MKFAVVDLSRALPVAELAAYAAAQQIQLRLHYAECYDGDGVDDDVRCAVDGVTQPGEVAILLHPSVPVDAGEGALGVHDQQADGTPVIHVYLDLAAKFGETWTSIASHEVLETRADPRLRACVELDDGSIFDKEICDRVEGDCYPIDGVLMSSFNTPSAFEPPIDWREQLKGQKARPGLFDWLGFSSRPNQVRKGGYAQEFVLGEGWRQHGVASAYRTELAKLALSRGSKRRHRRVKQQALAFDLSADD